MAALLRAAQRSAAHLCSSLAQPASVAARRAYASDESLELQVLPFDTHNCEGPSDWVTTNKSELMEYFEVMYRIRRMEIASDMLYKTKLIRGFCHLYDGQEAVVTGLTYGSTWNDSIITSYRDHAQHLVRGGSVKEVIGELLGRNIGASRGLGGSMHMYSKKNNNYGGSGIVGAQVPLGAGLALSHKMQNDGGCAFGLYGDGAANQGQVAESMNMAALWSLPMIFVIENNHFGMGTADWRGSKSPRFYKRGDYIPGIRVDGMDILAMKQATTWAKQFVLENGPLCLEADTYRYHGHSMSDPGSTYRTRDEVSSMRQARDPVERVRKLILDNKFAEASELKGIEKRIKKEIDEAIEEAKAAGHPAKEWLQANIYRDPTNAVMRGATAEYYLQAHNIAYE